MRGLFAVSRLSGLDDSISDMQTQINALQDKKTALDAQAMAGGGIGIPENAAARAEQINLLIAQSNAIAAQINDANAKMTTLTAAKAATPSSVAQAAREYVAQQALYTTIASQPQADYGRNHIKRNEFFSGLGGIPMKGLYGLNDRPTDSRRKVINEAPSRNSKIRGLGFDFSSLVPALEAGAANGAQAYIATPDKGQISLPSLPAFSIPGFTSMKIPSWLSADVRALSKPVVAVATGAINSARNAQAAKSAPMKVPPKTSAPSSFPWGYAALAAIVLGGVAYSRRNA